MMVAVMALGGLRVVEIAMGGEVHVEVEAISQEHIGELHFPGDGVAVFVALHDGLHDLAADTERRDMLDLAGKPD